MKPMGRKKRLEIPLSINGCDYIEVQKLGQRENSFPYASDEVGGKGERNGKRGDKNQREHYPGGNWKRWDWPPTKKKVGLRPIVSDE